MPLDLIFPVSDTGVDNGVWQQARPLFQYIDDFAPPDPPPHPPACSGGNRITAVSGTGALYDWRATDLPSGRVSINFIEGHSGGRMQPGGATGQLRFRTNDGAGPVLDMGAYNNANMPSGGGLCSSVIGIAGSPHAINPDTGSSWLPSELRSPYARFALTTNAAFTSQRAFGYSHIHIDTNLGGQGTLETVGICWLPPILAGLGSYLNLYAEDWLRFWQWFHGQIGCTDQPLPSRVNRKEREWLLDRLFIRPRFVFLGE